MPPIATSNGAGMNHDSYDDDKGAERMKSVRKMLPFRS
jgi:hypothetical protein